MNSSHLLSFSNGIYKKTCDRDKNIILLTFFSDFKIPINPKILCCPAKFRYKYMMEKAERAEMRKENFLKLAACGTFHPHMHELTHTPVSCCL